MRRKVLSILLAGSLLATVLAGCGSTGGTAAAESTAAPETTAAEESVEAAETTADAASEAASTEITSEPVEFTWMHHLQEEGKKAWVDYCIGQYTTAHPNVTINTEILTADEYATMLKTKIASGDAPMIFDLDTTNFSEFVSAGHVADVSGLPEYEYFDPGTLNQGQIDNVQYGVPLDVNAYCVFYNKAIFEEYGLSAPTTLSEFETVCQTLLDNGVTPFTTGFSEQWCLRRFADYVDIMCVKDNTSWYEDKMSGAASFASDDTFKEAMTIMESYRPYWGEDPFGETWTDVQNKLATGEAAMTINGSWIISGVSGINPDVELGAFAFPISENPEDAVMLEKPGNCFCVYNSEDADLLAVAKDFFAFMCSQDSAAYYAVSASGLTGCQVDVDAGSCINEINTYTGDKLYVQAGVVTFNSEYNAVFQDDLVKYLNIDGAFDVNALCEGLDADFASVQ